MQKLQSTNISLSFHK